MEVTEDIFNSWLKARNRSIDEFGEGFCYCGHTPTCSCADPNFSLFKHHVENRNILLDSPITNGWLSGDDMKDATGEGPDELNF